MSKLSNLRTWLLSHPWISALLAFIGVPTCFILTQLAVNARDATSYVKQLIPSAIHIGWSTAIPIIIITKISAPILAKIVIACMICLPPYVIYLLLAQPLQFFANPLLELGYLGVLGGIISYLIIKAERYKKKDIG